MEVRQHDRGQPRLVTVRHAVQEQRYVRTPRYSVVHAVRLRICQPLGRVVGLDAVLVDQARQQLGQVVVERRLDPRSGEECQVMYSGQGLAEPEHRFRQTLDGRVEAERAAVHFQARFVHNPLQQLPSRALQECVDVVVVAHVHQGVTPVGQPHTADPALRHVDRKPVSVGKLEVRAQHQRAVGASGQPHVGAEPLAEKPLQRVVIKSHRPFTERPDLEFIHPPPPPPGGAPSSTPRRGVGAAEEHAYTSAFVAQAPHCDGATIAHALARQGLPPCDSTPRGSDAGGEPVPAARAHSRWEVRPCESLSC